MNTNAIVNTAPGKLELRQIPVPGPGPGEVRIRTHACGVCATDLEMIAGWERTGVPAIPGHEWCGVVEALGDDVDPALEGRTVVGDNIMPDGSEVGFEHPGGYASRFITQAGNLVILPDTADPTQATLIEPLAVCLRGFKKVMNVLPADVLIFGDGPTGLLSLLIARHYRANTVTVAGGREIRLALAASAGANTTVNYRKTDDLADGVRTAAGRDRWPLIIEASGNANALNAAMSLGAIDARILVLGDYASQRADFAWNRLLHRELHLIGSNTGSGAWAEAVQLSAELHLTPLITHRFPAVEFQSAIRTVRDRASGAVKVVLEWE